MKYAVTAKVKQRREKHVKNVISAKAKQRLAKHANYVVFAHTKRSLEKLVKHVPFSAQKTENDMFFVEKQRKIRCFARRQAEARKIHKIRGFSESRAEARKARKLRAFRTPKETFCRAVASVFMEKTNVFTLPPSQKTRIQRGFGGEKRPPSDFWYPKGTYFTGFSNLSLPSAEKREEHRILR